MVEGRPLIKIWTSVLSPSGSSPPEHAKLARFVIKEPKGTIEERQRCVDERGIVRGRGQLVIVQFIANQTVIILKTQSKANLKTVSAYQCKSAISHTLTIVHHVFDRSARGEVSHIHGQTSGVQIRYKTIRQCSHFTMNIRGSRPAKRYTRDSHSAGVALQISGRSQRSRLEVGRNS